MAELLLELAADSGEVPLEAVGPLGDAPQMEEDPAVGAWLPEVLGGFGFLGFHTIFQNGNQGGPGNRAALPLFSKSPGNVVPGDLAQGSLEA